MSPSEAGLLRSEAVVDSFSRAARTYLKYAQVQVEMARWLSQWLPPGRRGAALEIGAGPGIFTERLIPWEGRLLATDLSDAMCAAGQLRVPQAEWRVMAAEAPSGGPWDWIFSSSMLQWAADPASTLAAWEACLAPGGRVVAGLFAAESLSEWAALSGESPPVTWRTPEEWRQALEGAGLRLLREDSVKRVFCYRSGLDFMRSIHGIGGAPGRRHGPGSLRRLIGQYEARHGGPGGVWASWSFYRFEAVRRGA